MFIYIFFLPHTRLHLGSFYVYKQTFTTIFTVLQLHITSEFTIYMIYILYLFHVLNMLSQLSLLPLKQSYPSADLD